MVFCADRELIVPRTARWCCWLSWAFYAVPVEPCGLLDGSRREAPLREYGTTRNAHVRGDPGGGMASDGSPGLGGTRPGARQYRLHRGREVQAARLPREHAGRAHRNQRRDHDRRLPDAELRRRQRRASGDSDLLRRFQSAPAAQRAPHRHRRHAPVPRIPLVPGRHHRRQALRRDPDAQGHPVLGRHRRGDGRQGRQHRSAGRQRRRLRKRLLAEPAGRDVTSSSPAAI